MFAQAGLQGDFLRLKETRMLFRSEQHFPSSVIERGRPALEGYPADMIGRARARVEELISGYQRPLIQSAHENAVLQFAEHEAWLLSHNPHLRNRGQKKSPLTPS